MRRGISGALELNKLRLACKTSKSFKSEGELRRMVLQADHLFRGDALVLVGVVEGAVFSIVHEMNDRRDRLDRMADELLQGDPDPALRELMERGKRERVRPVLTLIPAEVYTFHCKQDLTTLEVTSEANDVELPERCKINFPVLEVGERLVMTFSGIIRAAVVFGVEAI